MCIFLARFDMHGIVCAYFFVMAWVLPGVIMFSAYIFHFPIAMVSWGSHVLVEMDCQMDSKLSGLDL